MDVDKLRTFVNLAETLSFSKTAENLYIGQSNVSKHIHTLEKEIGNRLFLRNNKVTSLTEAGHLMYPYARKMVNIEDELKNELSKLKRNNNHQLTIGVIPTFSGYNAFKKITEYMKSHFEVTINFQEYETTELWKKLDEDKVDIAFIRVLNNQRLTGYQKIPFKNENFKLWIATNDNLAQRKKVTLRELKDYKFVSLTNSSQLKQPVIKLCQKVGLRRKLYLLVIV